jgi:hypothetical protein
MDKYSAWLDRDIALMVLELFDKKLNPVALQFELLLCGFLVRSPPAQVEAHLANMALTGTQLRTYTGFLHLVTLAMEKCQQLSAGLFLPDKALPTLVFQYLNDVAADPNGISESLLFKGVDTFNKATKIRHEMVSELLIYRSSDFLNAIRNEAREFAEQRRSRREWAAAGWEQLWSSLSSERGPWEAASDHAALPVPFRSGRLSGSLYPVHLQRKLGHDVRAPRSRPRR